MPGKAPVSVNGNRLNANAKSALKSARKGQVIEIFDIKVRNPQNPKYLFERVAGIRIVIR